MSKGNPHLTIRLPQQLLDQIPGEKAKFVRDLIMKEIQGGEGHPPKGDDHLGDVTQAADDIMYLLDFFNSGGSKQKCTPEQITIIKAIYGRAKTWQKK